MIRANILAFTNDANGHFPPPEKTAFFYELFHNKKITNIKFLLFMKKLPSRSDDNRRAAGAVDFSASRIHFL